MLNEKNKNLRKALLSDYLCLILCTFTVFMLLHSIALQAEDPLNGGTVLALSDFDDAESDTGTANEIICTPYAYNLTTDAKSSHGFKR